MWISKKDWETLISAQNYVEYWRSNCMVLKAELSIKEDTIKELRKNIETFKKGKAETTHYKELYLDELQKRLELAEIVRKMDGD